MNAGAGGRGPDPPRPPSSARSPSPLRERRCRAQPFDPMRVPILPDPDPTVPQVSVENDFSLLEEDQKGMASLQHSFASAIFFANEPCFLWIDGLTWVFYLGCRRFFSAKKRSDPIFDRQDPKPGDRLPKAWGGDRAKVRLRQGLSGRDRKSVQVFPSFRGMFPTLSKRL